MADVPQYGVTIRNLHFCPLVEYTDVIADGLVTGTDIKWLLRANKQRLEFSLNSTIVESSIERQIIIENQQAKQDAENIANKAIHESEQTDRMAKVKQYNEWQKTIKQAQDDQQV
jgi:hypothetical protein